MSMRIIGIDGEKGSRLLRIFFWFMKLRLGRVPPPLRVYAYRPAILWAFLRLARVIRRKGALPPRLKGLAMYWTARTVECSF